jgi:uncharacterized membrane protein
MPRWAAAVLSRRNVICAAALLILAVATLFFHRGAAETPPGREDVYYAWLEAERLAHGTNPYERVLSGDMLHNAKYATYLPAYYLLAAGFYKAGVTDYAVWLKFWRPVCELAQFAIAAFLLIVLAQRGSLALALCASFFWYFNRWTIAVVGISHLDTIAVLFLLLSLHLFERHKVASPLLFGLSLSVKHMALFLIPFYLLWEFRAGTSETALRRTVKAAALLGAIPLVLSLPFLIWSAPGLLMSILFSATRMPAADFPGMSFDAAMGLVGLPAKIPMLGLMLLAFVGAVTRRIGRYGISLMVLTIFLDFNSVLFMQYMVWTVPLLPLAVFAEPPQGEAATPSQVSGL